MAFIKNKCDCCQPAVCEECGCPAITTSKRFLAPGSEPQEGAIIVSEFTLQLADIEFCPCGCFSFGSGEAVVVPCSSGECDSYGCAACEETIAGTGFFDQMLGIGNLYNPMTLTYYSSTDPVNPEFGSQPGYYNIETTPHGGAVAANPDVLFVPNEVFVRPSIFSTQIEWFRAECLIAETENSLTYQGVIYGSNCFSTPSSPNTRGGTATLTWS